MRGNGKLALIVGLFAFAVLALVFLGEMHRRSRLESSPAEVQADTQPAGTPSEVSVPARQVPAALGPGYAQKAQGAAIKGPGSLRVTVTAPQRVAFGLAPVEEADQYRSAKMVESSLERLICATAGS